MGNRLSYGAKFHPGSFIPSPAGNTSYSTAGFVSLAVHPRVCGEHSGMPFCGTPETRQDRIRSALNKPSLQSKRYGKYYRNGVKEKTGSDALPAVVLSFAGKFLVPALVLRSRNRLTLITKCRKPKAAQPRDFFGASGGILLDRIVSRFICILKLREFFFRRRSRSARH